ncbi:hypothetical protein DAI22_01g131150 [Oryza sativa Japonica Group]|nr:hypothetical protein DAI22_01g131150 [Oryza sativa Japonica Group]
MGQAHERGERRGVADWAGVDLVWWGQRLRWRPRGRHVGQGRERRPGGSSDGRRRSARSGERRRIGVGGRHWKREEAGNRFHGSDRREGARRRPATVAKLAGLPTWIRDGREKEGAGYGSIESVWCCDAHALGAEADGRRCCSRGGEKGGAARELEGRPAATGQQGRGQEGPEEGGGEQVRREGGGGNRRQSVAVCRGGESGGTTREQERRPAARAAVRGESRGLQEGGDERIRRGDGRRRRAVMRGGGKSGDMVPELEGRPAAGATVWGGSRELKAGGGAGSRREGGQWRRSAERSGGGNRA